MWLESKGEISVWESMRNKSDQTKKIKNIFKNLFLNADDKFVEMHVGLIWIKKKKKKRFSKKHFQSIK